MTSFKVPLSDFSTFGDFLKFLRRRAQLSQRELSTAVGYSKSQISRLETNQRAPDPASILALFALALGIDDEPEIIERLTQLAKDSLAASTQSPIQHNRPAQDVNPGPLPSATATPVDALPTGMVTFLFTDIEGSTPLWEAQPEAMRESIILHHEILRRMIETHNGRVFKVVGDAFQAVFINPQQALQAALAAQRELRDAPWGKTGLLKVRMGLHTGEAELDPDGDEYAVSHTKNRAARVMSAGHGGQILLSEETANLVKRSLPDDIGLNDLGEHRLKGMEKLEHIYQVVVPDLPKHFPPLVSQQAGRNHLPIQLSSFIGRREDLVELCQLLRGSETRLVTLTGEGGCGKTRLALRAGEELAQDFEHGAWLVELAPLDNPQLVVKTIAAVFWLRESGHDPFAELVNFLSAKKTLLILDNCEHLVEEAARAAEGLLRHCPDLYILATSREKLEAPGETVFRVLPLSLPPAQPGGAIAAEAILYYDAIQLFAERAHSAMRTFSLNDMNAAAVARICQRLDGIPLAIELAAARVNSLSPAQIADRLEEDLNLLSGNNRFGLRHHQTLQATIDWSYNLLTEAERLFLIRLSVFSGGWMLEAAEAVAGAEPIAHKQGVDLLTGLVNKSLVQTFSLDDGMNRYNLLEPVRLCLAQKLAESGELGAIKDRHLDYFLHLAEIAEPHLTSHDQVSWLERLEQENDNLRAALDWCLERRQSEAGLRMAGALWRYWWITGSMVEGSRWCQSVLKLADEVPDLKHSRWRASALLALGFLLWDSEKPEEARPVLEESQALFRHLEDAAGCGAALCVLGLTYYIMYDTDRALAVIEEGLQYSYQAEDSWWIAFNKH